MVSFRLWNGSHSSPASFEKALSTQSARITDTQTKLVHILSKSRRARVLATLYLSFSYLVYIILLVLVVGWQNMGLWYWMGVVGGPIGVYVFRMILSAYYNFRIDSLAVQLKNYQIERSKTIQKLKDATKYESTLELLEKYGGYDKFEMSSEYFSSKNGALQIKAGGKRNTDTASTLSPSQTNIRPPPSANISSVNLRDRENLVSTSSTALSEHPSEEYSPHAFGQDGFNPVAASDPGKNTIPEAGTEDIVLEASAVVSQSPAQSIVELRWYDRILDLLMGEDEMAAKNRFVLICSYCRLVNGQAPPGTQSITDLGQWRCISCGMLNGEVLEADKIDSNVIFKQELKIQQDDRNTDKQTK